MPAPRFRLLLITDRHAVRAGGRSPGDALVSAVTAALAAAPPGEVAVMLREKDLCGRDLFGLAEKLREVTADAGAPLLLNDRVDVALAAGADGVHLPAAGLPPSAARDLLGPERLVGVSTHRADEATAAREAGADYVTFGPIHDTPSKRGILAPTGPESVAAIAGTLPVYGLGGVDPGRTGPLLEAGAAGVACIRAVFGSADPAAATAAFLAALHR